MIKNIAQNKIHHILNQIIKISNDLQNLDDMDIYDSDIDILDQIKDNLDDLENRLKMKNKDHFRRIDDD